MGNEQYIIAHTFYKVNRSTYTSNTVDDSWPHRKTSGTSLRLASTATVCHVPFHLFWTWKPQFHNRCDALFWPHSTLCMLHASCASPQHESLHQNMSQVSTSDLHWPFADCKGSDSCTPTCTSTSLPGSWSVVEQSGGATAHGHRSAPLSGWNALRSWKSCRRRKFLFLLSLWME